MKQLAELVPIALFFIVYQMDGQELSLAGFEHTVDGIFSATIVLMIATTVQVLLVRIIEGNVEKRLWFLFAAVMIFGSATVFFRNELFIQWKPTIFNWALAAVFLGVQLMGKKTLLARAMGEQLSLPDTVWQRLNITWVTYFFVVGALNLLVAYSFSEATWVSYKLYSAIGFTLLITGITVAIITPHVKEEELAKAQEEKP